MTVTQNTFISQMLGAAGLQTVPAIDGQTDAARYPVLADDGFAPLHADLVLLSSEPFKFRKPNLAEIAVLPGMQDVPARLIDGEMTSWYGSRAITGLHYLAEFRDTLDHSESR